MWSRGQILPSASRLCMYASFDSISGPGCRDMSLMPRGCKTLCCKYSFKLRPVVLSRAIPAQSMLTCCALDDVAVYHGEADSGETVKRFSSWLHLGLGEGPGHDLESTYSVLPTLTGLKAERREDVLDSTPQLLRAGLLRPVPQTLVEERVAEARRVSQ